MAVALERGLVAAVWPRRCADERGLGGLELQLGMIAGDRSSCAVAPGRLAQWLAVGAMGEPPGLGQPRHGCACPGMSYATLCLALSRTPLWNLDQTFDLLIHVPWDPEVWRNVCSTERTVSWRSPCSRWHGPCCELPLPNACRPCCWLSWLGRVAGGLGH